MLTEPITRRGVIALGGIASLAAFLSGCSTAPAGSEGVTSGDGAQLVLWTWPEGFSAKVLESVAKAVPDVSLRQDVIGGDFKQKLTTTFQAGSGLPAITGVKGEDIAFFASQPDFFTDLNTLGADSRRGEFLDWKWAQATAADGRQLGIPIDIGPTALFYRFDVFEKLGLPHEPEVLAAAIRTWDEYFNLGVEMVGKEAGTFLVRNLSTVFETAVKQTGKNFVDSSGKFIGAEEHIHSAWTTAVKAHTLGISAGTKSDSPDTQAAVAAGKLPADIGASWHLSDLKVDAPDTSGKWHVCAHPGDATNNGGSFLTIPKGTADAARAFEVIMHILNASTRTKEISRRTRRPSHPRRSTNRRSSWAARWVPRCSRRQPRRCGRCMSTSSTTPSAVRSARNWSWSRPATRIPSRPGATPWSRQNGSPSRTD